MDVQLRMQALRDVLPHDSTLWIALCARRLRERWPRLHLETLEEVAGELLRDRTLQELGPVEAAERWLSAGS